jgi:hypothetical protein
MQSISNELNDIISSFDWISPSFLSIEKIKDFYNILIYINNKDDLSNKSDKLIKLSSGNIYLPDSAIYYLNKYKTPILSMAKNDFTKSDFLYDFSADDMDIGILISFIILSTGEIIAFSFIDPQYLSHVYKFIELYIPELEKYTSSTINRLIKAILEGTEIDPLPYDAATAIFKMIPFIRPAKYPLINKAVGYAIWSRPKLAANIADISLVNIEEEIICYKNVMWSDVYATIILIKYAPVEELSHIEFLRK